MFQSDLVERAVLFAIDEHNGQTRRDGSAYILHPIRVGQKASQYVTHGHREFIMVCGVFHDLIEDTNVDYDSLRKKFGPRIADVVRHVTKSDVEEGPNKLNNFFAKVKEERERMQKACYYSRIVKAADVLDNIECMTNDVVQYDHDKEWATGWLLKKYHLLPVLNDVTPRLFNQVEAKLMSRLTELHPNFRDDRRAKGP